MRSRRADEGSYCGAPEIQRTAGKCSGWADVNTSASLRWLLARAQRSALPTCASRRAGAGNQSSRSAVRLYDAGLHNRSRNRARNWVHSRIWRSRDYFLSTPPTRKTAIVPFLRPKFVGRHVLGMTKMTWKWPVGWPRGSISRLSNGNFERLGIPSRKLGRPIEGGLSTLPVAISRRARPAPEPLPRLR